jgi:hypothetical protein
VAVLCAAIAVAQEPLPKAEAILDGYIEATGGRAAYEKLRNSVTAATMEIVGQGISFKMAGYAAAPNKKHTVIEIPGMGKMEEGTDGQVAWSLSTVQGPRIKEGQEKAQALLGAAFNSDLRWRELYKTAETVGVEEVNGQPCYQVLMTSNEGLQQTQCFDKKSGLLVKSRITVKAQMGDVPTESLPSDYKKVDGILLSHKGTAKVMGMDMVVTIQSVKHNVEIDESHFRLPDEIKALLVKGGAKESKP